jgi:hypothetical protein
VLNRVVVGCIWMGRLLDISAPTTNPLELLSVEGSADCRPGIQMFWGGQAVRIVLGALIGPKFVNMANTLPSSANVETADLVCFFIFVLILGRSR